MELKRFVKSVLKDVIDAVEELREESNQDIYLEPSQGKKIIEFDVAVKVENTSTSSGKSEVEVLQITGGETNVSPINRVRFGVYFID